MRVRHVVLGAAMTAVLLLSAADSVRAQTGDEWRLRFAAGEEARRADDTATYAREMAAAARAMPAGHLNRPFVQYHAARAAALDGRTEDAIQWLRTAWDEKIESLMISFAPFDPAFEDLVDSADFERVMALADALDIETRLLGGDVHLLVGAGSNVVAKVAPEGVLLVDTGYGPAYAALRRALDGLGGGAVRTLVVTHPHEDHMGSAARIGADAVVLAHPGTAAAMDEPYAFMDGVSIPAKPASARPDARIASDTTFVFGGEAVRIVPTVAHTTGDISVYFTESHVAHLGDTFLAGNPMMYPGTVEPDAYLDRLEAFLDSMHPETVIVGGHEDVTDLAAVRAQIAVTRDAMTFVRGAIADGRTIEETAEEGSDRFAPQWTAFFYQLFTQPGA